MSWILKEEFGKEARVINLHTVKPLDKDAVLKAAKECCVVLTAEEHQVGGLGNYVAAEILMGNLGTPITFDMIGVQDTFGMSGSAWELVKAFELTAEHIAKKAMEMLKS